MKIWLKKKVDKDVVNAWLEKHGNNFQNLQSIIIILLFFFILQVFPMLPKS